MRDLQTLEVFEIEVLGLLNSEKIIDQLFFGGGTMLRLCHNMNRYSTDLDFWINEDADPKLLYKKIKDLLSKNYMLLDSANKKYTLVFEFRSTKITRSLKIEIRKEQHNFEWERKIAFSKFADKQVMVKGLTLQQMMRNKTEALLSRKIIRDAFDIEFMLKRGIDLPKEQSTLEKMQQIINSFSEKEFKVTLGSILEKNDREFYVKNKFSLLKEEIYRLMNT